MSAPIIGKPPEQRTGHTFGDVPIRQGRQSMFIGRNDVAYIRMTRISAMRCDSGSMVDFSRDNEPVTPLTVTPTEPPPDPAVTTYGELEPEALFRWIGVPPYGNADNMSAGEVCRKGYGRPSMPTGSGYRDQTTGWWSYEPRFDRLPVRVLSPIEAAAHALGPDAGASVVVHEEPGTLVRRSLDPTSALLVLTGERPHYSRERAAKLCAQLAALLSTPEPATADPEPSTWYENEARKNGHGEDCARTEWDTNPCTCGLDGKSHPSFKHTENCPEPAEDRTKPAPGFPVDEYAPGRCRVKTGPVSVSYPNDQSVAGATEHSWERYDAEQARKAGESQ